jgi:hypothetical protein
MALQHQILERCKRSLTWLLIIPHSLGSFLIALEQGRKDTLERSHFTTRTEKALDNQCVNPQHDVMFALEGQRLGVLFRRPPCPTATSGKEFTFREGTALLAESTAS